MNKVDLDPACLRLSREADRILEYLDLHSVPIRPSLNLLDALENFLENEMSK